MFGSVYLPFLFVFFIIFKLQGTEMPFVILLIWNNYFPDTHFNILASTPKFRWIYDPKFRAHFLLPHT